MYPKKKKKKHDIPIYVKLVINQVRNNADNKRAEEEEQIGV